MFWSAAPRVHQCVFAQDLCCILRVRLVAGVGLNLQFANRIVLFDQDFNPMWNAQAACRIYRYGQQQETFVYHLVSSKMLSEQMQKRCYTKRRLSQVGISFVSRFCRVR
jgi:SNF2 family DNA or RNA helicase